MDKRKGFTLLELLVVIAIIALLMAILMPSLNKAREQAKRLKCMANLKNIGLAFSMYAEDYEGYFPNPVFFQFGNGDKWVEARTTGEPPDFETGLLYPYLQTKKVFLCPNCPLRRVVDPAIGTGGQPFGYDSCDPPVFWSYVMNGNPHWSLDVDWWQLRPEMVKPKPSGVMMVFDEKPTDYFAYDNTITWVHRTRVTIDDTLTDCHGGSGTILFFDGHVDMMLRKDYLEQVSTEEGTLRLWGGYVYPLPGWKW